MEMQWHVDGRSMSAEDFAPLKEMRRQYAAKKAERRAAFEGGPGWHKFSETHWRYTLNGKPLDFWPGPAKWQYEGRINRGNVYEFVTRREKDVQRDVDGIGGNRVLRAGTGEDVHGV